jgi:ATP-dependent Zn protease
VIEVSLGDRYRFVDITDEKPTKIDFSYSVKWEPTTKEFSQRLEKYVEMKMFPEEIEIQWFSIINSLVLVVLLTSFLAFIMMRILKKDFQNYTSEDDGNE